MAQDRREPTQATQPKGIDPTTGKPYPPVEISVPKRSTFDKLLERAEKPRQKKAKNSEMPAPLAALVVIPALAAGATLAVAIPAGDAVDDSVLILLGVPATVSAGATFALGKARNHSTGGATTWALASAVAALVWVGVLFFAGWAIEDA